MTDLEIPWTEKYRPNSFDEIVSQSIAVNNLKEFVSSGNMPHMIFSGPAGTGKTSTALIIAKYMLKGDAYYRNLLELNASDTVRMDYVREVLKEFVAQNMIIGEGTFKIVLLDESDNIPTTVQQALRRIIEKAPPNIKFILMCNYINQIIDPIISRCAVFRFVDLPKEKIIDRLKFIAEQEKLPIPKEQAEDFFNTLYFISGGDLRKAINTLQMSVALELTENLDINEILRISGFLDEETMIKLIKSLKEGKIETALKVFNSVEFFDSRNFIRQLLMNLLKISEDVSNSSDLRAFFGEIDYRISQGADERIQIMALLARIIEKVVTAEGV